MSLTGKTLAATYHSLLKLSTTDNQNFDGTLRNIVDGEDTASNLSLTDPSTGESIVKITGSHASGTTLLLENTATSGDTTIEWKVDSAVKWKIGVDDSETNDIFKISHSTALDTDERLTFKEGLTSFNDDSGDVDFLIRGDNDTALFFVDAGSDEIGIGTSNPAAKVHIYNNAANEGANGGLLIEQDHASGDAGLSFLLSTGEQYVMGIDHSSTADYFRITDGANFTSANAAISVYGDRVWCGLPHGTAMPSDDFGAYVTGENMDARFVSATGTSHLHIDGAANGACYVDFDEAGTRRGYIQYDQEASAANERMNFYVAEEGTKALSLAADSDGIFCSMGGTANSTDALELIYKSTARAGLTIANVADDSLNDTHNMKFTCLRTHGEVTANTGSATVNIPNGQYILWVTGETSGTSGQVMGYASSTAITTSNELGLSGIGFSYLSSPARIVITLDGSHAATQLRIWVIFSGNSLCYISAQT